MSAMLLADDPRAAEHGRKRYWVGVAAAAGLGLALLLNWARLFRAESMPFDERWAK